MWIKIIVAATFGLCASLALGNGPLKTIFGYDTDYTSDEMLRLLMQGTKLTYGKILNGNDTYGPLDKEITFWCINRKTNKTIQTFINDPDINSKIDTTKPLYTVTHGWIDNVNRTWVQNTLRGKKAFNDC